MKLLHAARFRLKLITLFVTRLRLDDPHSHQMPNQTVCRRKILCAISCRSDMTIECLFTVLLERWNCYVFTHAQLRPCVCVCVCVCVRVCLLSLGPCMCVLTCVYLNG